MQGQGVHPNIWLQYAVPIVIAVVVLALRVRRMTQLRPLKLERLWVAPAIYAMVVAMLYTQKPPSGAGWAVCLAALVLGAALGWQRGKTMKIHLDPQTNTLSQKASLTGIVFLVVLIAVKMAAQEGGRALRFDVALLADALGTLALGLFSATRLEMYLRGKRLLTTARGCE